MTDEALSAVTRSIHAALMPVLPPGFWIVCLIGNPETGNIQVVRNCDSECTVAMLEDVLSKEPHITETLSQ